MGDLVIGSHWISWATVFDRFCQKTRVRQLAEVKYYGAISVVKNESQSVETIWLAFVSWFQHIRLIYVAQHIRPTDKCPQSPTDGQVSTKPNISD